MEEKDMIIVEIDGEKKSVQSYERQNGFDPMTGEPKIETVIRNGFDPMTGEAAYAEVIKSGFDPMTGEATYKIAGQDQEEVKAEEPKAGIDPEKAVKAVKDIKNNPKTSKVLPIIGIVAAAIAVVAILAVILVNVFVPKQVKILKAAAKTIEADTFGSVLIDSAEILSSRDISCDVNVDVSSYGYSVEVEGSAGADIDNAKFGATGSIDAMGISQDFGVYYDDSKIQVSLPDVTSSVYEYNYTKKNNGAIADFIEEYTMGDIEDVNNILKSCTAIMKKSSKMSKASTKALTKPLSKIKISKADSREIEIDGKDRKCKGYKITITDKDIQAILEASSKASKDVYGKDMEVLKEAYENLTDEELPDTDDIMDEIYLDDDIEIEIFLYKGMLAAIAMEVDDEEIQVQFNGGDTRTSNMVVKYDKMKVLERNSSLDGKKEKGKLKIMGEKIDYSYDKSTGKFTVDFGTEIEATYLVKGNKIKFEMDESIYGVDAGIKVNVEKGARISPLKGKTFDLGNADEDDLYDEVEDIMYELDLY